MGGPTQSDQFERMTRPPLWWSLLALISVFGGAALLLLGSAFAPLDPTLAMARFVLIGGGLFALFPFLPSGIARFRTTVGGATSIFLWLLFGVLCLISSVVTYDTVRATGGVLWMLIGVPIIFFIGLPAVLGENAGKLVVLGLFVSHSLYIAISFYIYPELRFEYKGLFGHPNEMGMTAAVLALCCLAWIVERAESGTFTRNSIVALTTLFAANCVLVVASGSRTSLLAVLVTTAAAAFFCSRSLPRRRLFPTISVTLVALLLGVAFLPDLSFAQKTWDKHMQRLIKGDVLSKRDEIWEKTIDDLHFWGNGGEYFSEDIGVSAHNSLMQIMGERGPVAALIMACFAVLGLVRAFERALRRVPRRKFGATPALVSICFWTLSTGEGLFGSLGTGITLAYLVSVGVCLARETQHSVPQAGYNSHAIRAVA